MFVDSWLCIIVVVARYLGMLPLETRSDHLDQYRMGMGLLVHRWVEMLSYDKNNIEKVGKTNVQKAIENVFVALQD